MKTKSWVLWTLAILISSAGGEARAEAAADVFLLDAEGEAVCRLDGFAVRMHGLKAQWADDLGRLGDEPPMEWLPVCEREDVVDAIAEATGDKMLIGMAVPVGGLSLPVTKVVAMTSTSSAIWGCMIGFFADDVWTLTLTMQGAMIYGAGVLNGSLSVIGLVDLMSTGARIVAGLGTGFGNAVAITVGHKICGGTLRGQ